MRTLGSTAISTLFLASFACSSAHNRVGAERDGAVDARPEANAPARSPAPAVAAVDAPPPEAPLAEYRGPFLRELTRVAKAREAKVAEGDVVRDDAAPVPFSIEVLKKVGQSDAMVVATLGFGRVPHGRERARVELLAYVEQYGVKIGDVLAALGRTMHATGDAAPSWKEYDTVKLETPAHGMIYFDLRAAGDLVLGCPAGATPADATPSPSGAVRSGCGAEGRVVLLKVIPMSEEEFEKSKKNVSAEWDDPNANARATQRWSRLLEPGR